MGTKISFPRADGKPATGYLAKRLKANAPGVVVIQEWWGLQDQIRGICDRLALAGYEALAPDLYAGTVVPYHDREAAAREMNSLNFAEATDQVVRGAVAVSGQDRRQGWDHGFLHGRRGCHSGGLPHSGSSCCRRLLRPAAGNALSSPPTSRCRCEGHYANIDDYITPQKVDAFAGAPEGGKTQIQILPL